MNEVSTLSVNGLNILEKYFYIAHYEKRIQDASKKLIVSLTELLPGIDKNLLYGLRHFSLCLDDILTKEEQELLLEEYKAVVRYCFNSSEDFVNDHGSGRLYLSDSILSLLKLNAQPKAGSSVFLPFAGEGTFASLCTNCKVEGFEYNADWCIFSNIILSAYASKASIFRSDWSESLVEGKKYDYIFAYPPIGVVERKTIDILYNLITKHLSDNGKFMAILPKNFCNASSGWFDIRKILYDYKDYSVMVIALPTKIQSLISIPLCMVRIEKNKHNAITLMDISSDEFVEKLSIHRYNRYNLVIDKVTNAFMKEDKRYVWKGHTKDLLGNLDLNPARYILAQNAPAIPEGSNVYKLKDICRLIPLSRKEPENVKIPIIGMKDLSSSYMNCDIDYFDIQDKTDRYIRLLDTNAFLVGFINGKMKVGRISGLSYSRYVALRPEVFAISLHELVVTEDFFLRSLLCEYTERQAKAMVVGGVVSRIQEKDLLDIEIVAPSREDQSKLCLEDSRKDLSESDRKILDTHEDFRQDMHMKKHAIGQTIFNLNNWWKVLMKARKEGNGIISDSAFVGIHHPIQVSTVFENFQEVLAQLQQQISKLDRGNGLVVKNMALTSFIEEYIRRKQSPIFNFVYDSTPHHITQDMPELNIDEENGVFEETGRMLFHKGDPFEFARFSPDALEIIFDNIVSNACSHGFVGREENNLIRINLFSEEDNYAITIANNGLALDSQLTEKKVFTYGETTELGHNHFGIGGYEVKKLMNEFGGDAFIISNPDSEYPVMYKLIFHDTDIEFVL